MAIKITLKQMIVMLILAALFIALTNILITTYLNIPGWMITTGGLVIIFVIVKIYQYNKTDNEKDEEG